MKTSLKIPISKRSTLLPLANRNIASGFAVLAAFLLHGPPKAAAQAPSSIAGSAISALFTNSDRPPFPSPGSRCLLLQDSSGNGYQVRNIWQVDESSGAYSWSASGATATATYTDIVVGSLAGTFTFANPSSGTYFLDSGGRYGYGNFELLSGSAPGSVAGNVYSLQIEDGASPFSSTGSQLLKIGAGNSYEIVGDGVNVPSSSGTYSYSRLNTSTGSLLLNDSLTGSSTLYLSFSNSVAGGFAVTQLSPGGFQVGHFTGLPPLNMAIQDGNVVLSWSTNFGARFILQSTVNLGVPGWTTLDLQAPPVIINGQYAVTLSNAFTNTQQYYQLKSQ